MNNDYNSFLLRWKEERKRCGLTQQQLCRCMKISQSTLSKSETGKRRFTYPEIKGACTSGMDVYYVFTGSRAESAWALPELPEQPEPVPEESLCHLGIVYAHASAVKALTRFRTFSKALSGGSSIASSQISFEKIQQQLDYLQYASGSTMSNQNTFYCVRHYYGHTQKKMAGMLSMDIKKLRKLEKGQLLPDSEIIWRMYGQFRVSPAFILKDAAGLRNELDYVLGLLKDDDREIILQILGNSHKLMWRS